MRILLRVLISLLLINFLLLGVYYLLSKKEPRQQVKTPKMRVYETQKKGSKVPRLYYKTGEVVEFGVRLLDSIENGGDEDMFEISGIVDRVWQENKRVFLRVALSRENGLKLTFDMGEIQDFVGVNRAKEGKIGRYTADKVGNIFNEILPSTPILLHAISRIDIKKLGNDCDVKCRAFVGYVNSNYSKFSGLFIKLSKGGKAKIPNSPVGHVSQVVYYVE